MWLQGHMDQMQAVGTGPWVQMSPSGEQIQVFHHLQRGGISDSSLKGYRIVRMTAFNSTGLLHHQMIKKVGAGSEATTYMIFTILLQMVLVFSSAVHLTFLRVLSGHLLQYKKSVLTIMKLQLGKVNPLIYEFSK